MTLGGRSETALPCTATAALETMIRYPGPFVFFLTYHSLPIAISLDMDGWYSEIQIGSGDGGWTNHLGDDPSAHFVADMDGIHAELDAWEQGFYQFGSSLSVKYDPAARPGFSGMMTISSTRMTVNVDAAMRDALIAQLTGADDQTRLGLEYSGGAMRLYLIDAAGEHSYDTYGVAEFDIKGKVEVAR